MTPTELPLVAAPQGAAPAFEACPTPGCLYGRGHRVECAVATGNRVRRCRGCDEPVNDRHLLGCLYSEADGLVAAFDCAWDA
jgi:hypothetical protein